MLFCALASDYDGTLARDGRVDEATLEALRRFKATGKRLILITGRELADLRAIFDYTDDFRRRGGRERRGDVLARHAGGASARSAPARALHRLAPREGSVVLETIRELGLDWQLTFNKGAVMCLPPGINKASGLQAAIGHLKLSASPNAARVSRS